MAERDSAPGRPDSTPGRPGGPDSTPGRPGGPDSTPGRPGGPDSAPAGRDRVSLAQEALASVRAQAQAKGLRPAVPRPRQPGPGEPGPSHPRPPETVDSGPLPVDDQPESRADDASPEPDFVPPRDGGPAGSPSDRVARRANPRREPLRRVRRDDPQPLGAAIEGLLENEGWTMAAATGSVFGRWAQIVGPELADHTEPEALRDGELTVVADSTAWATQLRLLAAQLVRRLNAELGPGAVQRVKVRGPVTAIRRPGEWRVRGSRGPRDTYG